MDLKICATVDLLFLTFIVMKFATFLTLKLWPFSTKDHTLKPLT